MNLESLKTCLPAAFSTTEVMVSMRRGVSKDKKSVDVLGGFKDQL